MLKRLNDVLPELIIGIVVYGLVVQFAGVWFVEDKLLYSTGLWIGIGIAIGMAIHLALVIESAVSLELEGVESTRRSAVKSVLRYIIVAILMFAVVLLHLGNIITCFIGVMGLKASAYLQPFTHRCIEKIRSLKKGAGCDAK